MDTASTLSAAVEARETRLTRKPNPHRVTRPSPTPPAPARRRVSRMRRPGCAPVAGRSTGLLGRHSGRSWRRRNSGVDLPTASCLLSLVRPGCDVRFALVFEQATATVDVRHRDFFAAAGDARQVWARRPSHGVPAPRRGPDDGAAVGADQGDVPAARAAVGASFHAWRFLYVRARGGGQALTERVLVASPNAGPVVDLTWRRKRDPRIRCRREHDPAHRLACA
jgi:hypothetical protein